MRSWGDAMVRQDVPSWLLEEDVNWWSGTIPSDEEEKFVARWVAKGEGKGGGKGYVETTTKETDEKEAKATTGIQGKKKEKKEKEEKATSKMLTLERTVHRPRVRTKRNTTRNPR